MNISLREIEYVMTVAQEGSVTHAAQKLYIAQPSLSQSLKKIDHELGITMFTHANGRMKLTVEGQCFMDAAKRVVNAMGDLKVQLSDLSQLNSGSVTLGIPYHLSALMAPHIVQAYHERYPGVKIVLREESSGLLEKMLAAEELDAAIFPLPVTSKYIAWRNLFTSRMVIVMSKSSPLNKLAYEDPEKPGLKYFDLKNAANESFILGMPGQRIRAVTEVVLERAGIHPETQSFSRNIYTIRRMAAWGLGLTLMPEHYLDGGARHMTDANAYYITESQDYKWDIVIAYNTSSYLSHASAKMLDIVEELYGESGCPLDAEFASGSLPDECPYTCKKCRRRLYCE